MDIRDFIGRIRQLADENGDRTLFVEGSRRVTRREFLDTAYRVNARIRQEGVSGRFIPIVLPNSADYLAAEFGIWMSGNASVHLGDSLPPERIKYIVDECEAPLVIDSDFIRSSLQCAPDDEMAERTPDRDCVMFYTSGSTGNPKGVLHSDRGYMSGILRSVGTLGTTGDEVRGNVAPFYFIAVILVMEGMYSGAVIDLMDRDTVTDMDKLRRHIIDHGITSAFMSPSLLSALDLSELPLEKVLTGSERLTMTGPTDRCRIYNLYGQTESALQTLSFRVDKPYENTPLGRPSSEELAPVIVDENGNEVPPGEDGELCFRGITPCKYFKDPEKTAELMRRGMFHTGDIFRQLPSGDYLFVNRKDWMVKINGQRVEPGEVEAALRRIDGVAGAIVKGFDSGARHGQYLCAYYIPASEITEDEIRRALERTLPSYMVPSYFVRMDRFPVNANGKLDRKSLRAPAAEAAQAEYVAPSDEVEVAICEAFSKVLNIKRAGAEDDFFLLGGDSVRLMQVQSECPKLRLSSKLIYRERTPRRIALALREGAEKRLKAESLPDYPLNDTLELFYGMSEKFSQSAPTIFHLPSLFRLDAGTDLRKLAEAIETTIAAHPSMRMKIIGKADGEKRLVNEKEYTYHQEIERISDRQFEELKPKLVQPMDLLNHWLFRIRIIQTDSAGYLFYDFHHLISDGTSSTIFVNDISRAYNGEPLQPEDATIFKLNVETERLKNSEEYEEAKGWFSEEFRNSCKETAPHPDLAPSSREQPSFRQTSHKLDIPPQSELEAFCTRMDITPNVLFMSAAALVTGHLCGLGEALLSTSYHGRVDISMHRTIGFIAKPRCMHFHWYESMPVKDYLLQSKEHILGNLSRDSYPISVFVKECGLSEKMVMCIYQGKFRSVVPILGNGVATEVPMPSPVNTKAFSFFIFDREDGGYDICLVSIRNLYSDKFVSRVIDNFERAVNQMMRVSDLREIKFI